MGNILYISNIAGKKTSINFYGTALAAAKEKNLEFYNVANRNASTQQQIKKDEQQYNIHLLHADIKRFPFSLKNLRAYKQIVRIIKENNIDYIHCNTPIGGVLGRMAGKKCKVKRIIYQAHGFHFYKGAPLINWLLYYPIERFLAHYTDAIITINEEDYNIAQKFKIRNNGNVYLVPGVGIKTDDYVPKNFDRVKKREELGLSANDIMVISAGDLIKRKNYKASIKAISFLNDQRVQYFICGQGPLKSELEAIVEKENIKNNVHFLGYRTDVKELLWASDVFLFSSYQEGLPRSLSEAMASGLPCIVSNIRGNTDLMLNEKNGYLINPDDFIGFGKSIKKLVDNSELRKSMSEESLQRIEQFGFDSVKNKLFEIYDKEFDS